MENRLNRNYHVKLIERKIVLKNSIGMKFREAAGKELQNLKEQKVHA